MAFMALFMLCMLCRRFHFEFLLHFFCQFGSIWIFISRSVCHSCFNQTFWHFYDISFHNLHSKTYFLAELNNWQCVPIALHWSVSKSRLCNNQRLPKNKDWSQRLVTWLTFYQIDKDTSQPTKRQRQRRKI